MSSGYGWVLAVMMLFPMGVVGTDGPSLTTPPQKILVSEIQPVDKGVPHVRKKRHSR